MEQVNSNICYDKCSNEATLRVVLLCHVSSPEIRDRLPLVSPRVRNFFYKLVRKPQYSYFDFAPWIVNTIHGFEFFNNIDLHVVAPHQGLKRWVFEYTDNGTHYHFFRPEPLFPWVIIEKLFLKKQYKEYPRTRKLVQLFINKIQPDIVDLVGAENPYYSICGLDINNMPLFITCQTVYSNPNRQFIAGRVSKERWDLEQLLFKKANALCCMNTMYRDLILEYAPDSIIFPLTWPDAQFPKLRECEKKYDFAFFSVSVSKKKGIDSAIEALSIVKKQKPDVTLLVVGHIDKTMKEVLPQRIHELGLTDNIIFHDFFPSQLDMFNFVKQARFALLPVKLDFISGTILQAMEMGMPVITHITSGTPTLNSVRETVLLSEIGDIETMAGQMIYLMEDKQLAAKLIENGYAYMQAFHKKSMEGITRKIKQYSAVIDYFYHDVPIPSELLYS